MEPEDLARRLFDMWQDSFASASQEPAFNAKLLQLVEHSRDLQARQTQEKQRYEQLYPQSGGAASKPLEIVDSYDSSHQQPSRINGSGTVSVQELAGRLEECEQRIHVLETILRGWFREIPKTGKRTAERKSAAGTTLPERA